MHRLCKYVLTALFACAVLSPLSASAADYNLIIGPPPPPPLSAAVGESSAFIGGITNLTGATISSSQLSLQFSGYNSGLLSPNSLLDSQSFTLESGGSIRGIPIFTLALDESAKIGGTFPITITLVDNLNRTSNSVTVSVTAVAVPEPATLLLLGTGLAGAAFKARKRSRKSGA
jgi:hypothetical protein